MEENTRELLALRGGLGPLLGVGAGDGLELGVTTAIKQALEVELLMTVHE